MSSSVTQSELRDFQSNGFLNFGKVLTDKELSKYLRMFDEDRKTYPYMWHPYGFHQHANYEALISSPQFDDLIRQPVILEKVRDLMGGPVCFGEIGLRLMNPYHGETHQEWHRDRGYWFEHPLRLDYMQLLVYLTDVDHSTHCFSISPESINSEPQKRADDQIARNGTVDVYGPAGTCVLFNVALFHTATTRETSSERKTIQVYYGHQDRAPLANDSGIPARLSQHPESEETRMFYGNLNDRSRLYMRAYGTNSEE